MTFELALAFFEAERRTQEESRRADRAQQRAREMEGRVREESGRVAGAVQLTSPNTHLERQRLKGLVLYNYTIMKMYTTVLLTATVTTAIKK